MISVQGFNHLYLRNNNYYFRFIYRKFNKKFSYTLGLKTTNLTEAVVLLDKLNKEVDNLKALSNQFTQTELMSLITLFNGFKEKMKKQLEMHHIDSVLSEAEISYVNNAHFLNVLAGGIPDKVPKRIRKKAIKALKNTRQFSGVEAFEKAFEGLTEEEETICISMIADSFSRVIKADTGISHDGITKILKTALEVQGYEYDETSMEFQILLSRYKSSHQIQNALIESVKNGDSINERQLFQLLVKQETPVNPAIIQPIRSTLPTFTKVYQEFIDFKVNKEHLSEKAQKDYERKYIVWQALTEDKAIDQYTPKDIGLFIDRCFELPKMNIGPYNKMDWNERLEVDVPEEDFVSPKSVSHFYKWLQSVFAYAKRDTIAYITVSPCSIKREYKSKIRGIFDDVELSRLLKDVSTKAEWQKWVVYLAVYSGARRGEIAQLRKEDVKFDNVTGRHYLLITDEHENQKLKTENAKRKIPIHSAVIEAGFIDYVNQKNDRIFDEITNGEAITRWFSKYMQSLDIDGSNEIGHIRSFHSFRHSFITKLMNTDGMNVNLLQQVVGHELSKLGITSKYTHKATDLKLLLSVVDAFEV